MFKSKQTDKDAMNLSGDTFGAMPDMENSDVPNHHQNLFEGAELLDELEISMADEQERARKRMIAFSILLAALAAVFAWLWWKNKNEQNATTVTTPTVASSPETESTEVPPTPTTEVATVETSSAELQKLVPVDDTDLKRELPADQAVIDEEVDRLSDEQGRLKTKADILEKQAQTTSEMIALKEKQLAELKAQLDAMEKQQ